MSRARPPLHLPRSPRLPSPRPRQRHKPEAPHTRPDPEMDRVFFCTGSEKNRVICKTKCKNRPHLQKFAIRRFVKQSLFGGSAPLYRGGVWGIPSI